MFDSRAARCFIQGGAMSNIRWYLKLVTSQSLVYHCFRFGHSWTVHDLVLSKKHFSCERAKDMLFAFEDADYLSLTDGDRPWQKAVMHCFQDLPSVIESVVCLVSWELWPFMAIRCHPYMLHDSRRSKVVEKLGVGPEAAHEPTQSDHA